MASFRCCRTTDFGCSRTLRESVAVLLGQSSLAMLDNTFGVSVRDDDGTAGVHGSVALVSGVLRYLQLCVEIDLRKFDVEL